MKLRLVRISALTLVGFMLISCGKTKFVGQGGTPRSSNPSGAAGPGSGEGTGTPYTPSASSEPGTPSGPGASVEGQTPAGGQLPVAERPPVAEQLPGANEPSQPVDPLVPGGEPPYTQEPPVTPGETYTCTGPLLITSAAVTSHTLAARKPGSVVKVPVEYRDFKSFKEGGHQDFENDAYNTGHKENMVGPELGSDGLPVFTGTDGDRITSAATLAQWYRDVPGVNETFLSTLDLVKDPATNVYRFKDETFFPLTGMGFDKGLTRQNFHFTAKIASTFVYRGGESFTFIGDDDVWVFVNKKKIIDLGGVHGALHKTVHIDTANRDLDLKLELGKAYDFVIFFAERHYTASTFQVETTLELAGADDDYLYPVKTNATPECKVTYQLEDAPVGMSIDAQTGEITWPAPALREGSHLVKVKATNAAQTSAYQQYHLTVKPAAN